MKAPHVNTRQGIWYNQDGAPNAAPSREAARSERAIRNEQQVPQHPWCLMQLLHWALLNSAPATPKSCHRTCVPLGRPLPSWCCLYTAEYLGSTLSCADTEQVCTCPATESLALHKGCTLHGPILPIKPTFLLL